VTDGRKVSQGVLKEQVVDVCTELAQNNAPVSDFVVTVMKFRDAVCIIISLHTCISKTTNGRAEQL
jgi:hypothetical protein